MALSHRAATLAAVYAGLTLSVAAPTSASQTCDITIGGQTLAGDPTKGKRTFLKCRACHTLTASTRRSVGPHLEKLFTRDALSVEGYAYSAAFQDTAPRWTHDSLSAFIESPTKAMRGNKMMFAGLRSAEERVDVIAYLEQQTDPDSTACSQP